MGVDREWPFNVFPLAVVQVVGPMFKGCLSDGLGGLDQVVPPGECPLKLSPGVLELGLVVHGSKGSDGFLDCYPLKGVRGNVGRADGKTKSVGLL